MKVLRPRLPYDGFPLRPHGNGQWYKSVWNPRTKTSEQFYFGPWRDDPKGERAMKDPQIGWLARRDAIKAGVDNIHVQAVAGEITLGELMSRFLIYKRGKSDTGELSKTTLGGYLSEIEAFVSFFKPGTPAGGLKPEHFGAYMRQLVEKRKLGRHARKRVRAYITAFLHYGVKNGWLVMPNTGTDWVAPATDPESMRQAKARAGLQDYSDRIVTGEEINKLLARANPTFKAMILLGINCGLGPADLGRVRWNMLDLERGRLCFPRPKTGVRRLGYLWKKTREALVRIRTLKHNSRAIRKDGEAALVFITRTGRACYREREVHELVSVNETTMMKLTGVAVSNTVSSTFSRMTKELSIEGLRFYALRHTFRTLGQAARDREALNLAMGHRDISMAAVYDHEQISWARIKRVARVVRQRLWPKPKQAEGRID